MSLFPGIKSELNKHAGSPRPGRYEWLQCFRGFAALLVVGYHFYPQLERYDLSPYFAPVLHWGFWGVDIFFVLSGFVIAMSASKLAGLRDGALFIAKRSFRVYLGYWPALALWVSVLTLTASPVPPGGALDSILLLSGVLTDHWLPIAWSLYYELLFYVLFFGLIVAVPPSGRFVCISMLFLLMAIWHGYWISQRTEVVLAGIQPWRELLSAFFIEFFLGILLYQARALFKTEAGRILCLFAMVVFFLAIGMHSPLFDKVESLRVATLGLAAAATVGIALCLEGLRAPRLLVRIGDASYSLYLTHIIILKVVVWLVATQVGFESITGEVMILLIPVMAVVFSLYWYQYIERPLYEAALRRLPSSTPGSVTC